MHVKGKNFLNDCLSPSFLLLQGLIKVLLQFCLHPIVVLWDTKKAFLQVGLKEENRDFVRFFWLKNPYLLDTTDNLISYKFTRVAFGLTCLFFLLATTIVLHFSNNPSDVANKTTSNLYVDNIMLAAINPKIALQLSLKAKNLFSTIGPRIHIQFF